MLLRDTSYSRIPFLDRLLSGLRVARHMQKRIDEAGMPIKAGPLILSMLSAAAFVWLIVGSVLGREIIGLVLVWRSDDPKAVERTLENIRERDPM